MAKLSHDRICSASTLVLHFSFACFLQAILTALAMAGVAAGCGGKVPMLYWPEFGVCDSSATRHSRMEMSGTSCH